VGDVGACDPRKLDAAGQVLNPCGLIGAWGWGWDFGGKMIGRSRATEWCKFERLVVSIKDAGSIFKKMVCFFCLFLKKLILYAQPVRAHRCVGVAGGFWCHCDRQIISYRMVLV
jgi:hypothetical protein